MSINEIWEKIKYLILILLISLISYGIGRLSLKKVEKVPISVKSTENTASVKEIRTEKVTAAEQKPVSSEVVASKTGKKYFWPWCGSAKRIKPENKIIFNSPEAATKAGLTPAGNCKGLK